MNNQTPSSNGNTDPMSPLNLGELVNRITTPAAKVLGPTERITYEEAKEALKYFAKQSFGGRWDSIKVGGYVSKCLIIDIPTDDSFRRFVTQFEFGLRRCARRIKNPIEVQPASRANAPYHLDRER